MRSHTDFRALLAVFGVGLSVPLVLVELLHPTPGLYLTAREFTFLSAVAFAVFAWCVLAVREVDHVEFATASLVFPPVAAFVALPVLAGVWDWFHSTQYVFRSVEHVLRYVVAFAGAGLAAVGLQRVGERVADRHSWSPAPRVVPLGLAAILVLAAAVGGAYAQYTASKATVERVETGVHDFDPEPGFHDYAPVLNVTIEGQSAELLVRVTGPNGETHVDRVPASALRDGTATVPVPLYYFTNYAASAGVYDVSVQSLAGVTVATASHTIEAPPEPELTRVATAAAGDPLDVDLPENSVHMRQGPGPEDSHTRVAVVLENRGDAPAWVDVAVMFDEDDGVDARRIVRVGEPAGFVFDVPPDVVDRVHETGNGTVTVEVTVGEQVLTETVELPEE